MQPGGKLPNGTNAARSNVRKDTNSPRISRTYLLLSGHSPDVAGRRKVVLYDAERRLAHRFAHCFEQRTGSRQQEELRRRQHGRDF